jgi:predicted AAA+ superfamily ATPase
MQYFKRDIEKDLMDWKIARDNNGYKNLLITGARQTGKSTLIRKFIKDNYTFIVRINFLNQDHLDKFNEWKNECTNLMSIESLTVLFRKFNPSFADSENVAILIEEIHLSTDFYNYIRQITNILKSRLIFTGNYLGLFYDNPKVVVIATELLVLRLEPLSFHEFVNALGYNELYNLSDVLGSSDSKDYDKLQKLFNEYLLCGGYPSVVQEYKLSKRLENVDMELERIYHLILDDIYSFFSSSADLLVLVLNQISNLLLKNSNYTIAWTRLESVLAKSPSTSRLSKKTHENLHESIYKALNFYSRNFLLGECGKAFNCTLPRYKIVYKYYFNDVGLSRWLVQQNNYSSNVLKALEENYIFNFLNKLSYNNIIFPKHPVSATYNNFEINFLFKSRKFDSQFALILDRTQKSQIKSSDIAFNDGIINYMINVKDKGPFGKYGNVFNVPIYLIEKFNFDLGELRFPSLYEFFQNNFINSNIDTQHN